MAVHVDSNVLVILGVAEWLWACGLLLDTLPQMREDGGWERGVKSGDWKAYEREQIRRRQSCKR